MKRHLGRSLLASAALAACLGGSGETARADNSGKPGTLSNDALADQITALPGAPFTLPFRQFAGYLNVDKTNNRNIFYWYVEAEQNAATAPVAVWTNGGPGCSGLLGFLSEHGPFRPNKDGKTLSMFPYNWNKLANMVYIEAPAGVGFSYSDVASDYKTDDAHTAADNYLAIEAFLQKFPQLANNDLYITSESYGGHYMPTLAKAIVDGNAAGTNPQLNFKGFLVGNPYNDSVSNNAGTYQTVCGHSLAPKPECDAYTQACTNGDPNSDACGKAESAIDNAVGNLDPYAIDFPTCAATSQAKALRKHLGKKFGEHSAQARVLSLAAPGPYDPCAEDELTTYLNQAEVVQAIHAVQKQPWAECSSVVQYGSASDMDSMTPIYQYLAQKAPNLHIRVYSGDDDTVCATLGAQVWMYDLNKGSDQAATPAWQPWLYTNDQYGQQIGGYYVQWPNVELMTVHGAGHMVPQTTPEQAFEVLNSYLNGKVNTVPPQTPATH